MKVSLPRAIEELARTRAAVGDHGTASEVARDGLRLLKRRDERLPSLNATRELPAPSPRPEKEESLRQLQSRLANPIEDAAK